MFSFMAVTRKPMQRAEKMEELQRRNEELEREVREGREKEKELKRELERLKQRLSIVEEAEEQLCFQLGELEAEAVAQARAYSAHVKALSDHLAHARSVLNHCHLQHATVD